MRAPRPAAHGNHDLGAAAWAALANLWLKAQLVALGLLHLLFSRDARGELSSLGATRSQTQTFRSAGSASAATRRVVFVRHAESEWNVVFNRGGSWRLALRLVRALLREWLLLPVLDSLFIDSPLSARGVDQAKALADHVAHVAGPAAAEAPAPPAAHWLRYLAAPLPGSVVVTSNLRRAIDTARIASAARLGGSVAGERERIHVLSSLQEIGRNIDTLALSDAYSAPPLALTASMLLQNEKRHDELLNLTESHGNKAVLGSARSRLRAFAAWAFQQRPHDVLVVYGHSHWFRAFCREFFPPACDHPLKTEKLANCAVVTFELHEHRADGGSWFVVPPASFEYVR